jgi:SAM-dependent methyltransferase
VMTNDGIRVEEAHYCFLCKSAGIFLFEGMQDRLYNVPGLWSILRCAQCGLAWLHPRPLSEDIGKLYVKYYTHLGDDDVTPNPSTRISIREKLIAHSLGYKDDSYYGANRIIVKTLSSIPIVNDLVRGKAMWLRESWRGRLLDIGCGDGGFLSKMKHLGWDVVGVEPDPSAARVARERYGLTVLNCRSEDVEFDENSFDVITLNHVIEHLVDPLKVLRRCRRFLRRGGRFVLTTPNVESLGQYIFKRNWFPWDPPRHIFLFSPASLKRFAEEVDVYIDELRTVDRGARDSWYFSSFIHKEGHVPENLSGHLTPAMRAEAYTFWLVEYMINSFRPCGEEILMIAIKK